MTETTAGNEGPFLGHPARITAADEGLHPRPDATGLWGDTFWLSAIDPAAGIVGVHHFHLTNRGFGRFQAHYWIDGVQQSYGRKAPVELVPGLTSWTDGFITYEVLEPFERIRLTMDSEKFGFDLEYRARFPMFDWADCKWGDPTGAGDHGAHLEQPMTCRGSFEIRSGPAAGQTREIDCLAHRDHGWSDRFGRPTPWELPEDDVASHFWLQLLLPDRHVNAVGFFDAAALGFPEPEKAVGGFECSSRGNRPVVAATPVPGYDGNVEALREQGPTSFRIAVEGGETLTVRATKVHGTAKLWMRGEDDLENRLDDWEQLVDLEIEETGERGQGVFEHSLLQPRPRWSA